VLAHLTEQPTDAIAEYFGEHVAFYFAWLACYTNWLVAPTILGASAACFENDQFDMLPTRRPIIAIIRLGFIHAIGASKFLISLEFFRIASFCLFF
jgi:hypothetical protein